MADKRDYPGIYPPPINNGVLEAKWGKSEALSPLEWKWSATRHAWLRENLDAAPWNIYMYWAGPDHLTRERSHDACKRDVLTKLNRISPGFNMLYQVSPDGWHGPHPSDWRPGGRYHHARMAPGRGMNLDNMSGRKKTS